MIATEEGKETTLKSDSRPLANPHVLLREEFDDWAVLYDPDTGLGFGLSPTGVHLWKLLDGEHSIDEMLKVLHREFQEVPQEASTHIGAFVEEATSQGLATYATGEGIPRRQRSDRPPRSCVTPTHDPALKPLYEAPTLINLNSEYARGVCCNTGGGAGQGTCCVNVGNLTYAGACKTVGAQTAGTNVCQNGTTAPYSCITTGSTANGTMGCVTNGNAAHGGFGCGNGGVVT